MTWTSLQIYYCVRQWKKLKSINTSQSYDYRVARFYGSQCIYTACVTDLVCRGPNIIHTEYFRIRFTEYVVEFHLQWGLQQKTHWTVDNHNVMSYNSVAAWSDEAYHTSLSSSSSSSSSLLKHFGLVGLRWFRGSAVERWSSFDRRAFAVLRSTCSWRVTTYVGKPSAIGQPTPFILSGSKMSNKL